jgi:ABC-type bacteriocin/lantibiotic exporter with double-glycine peptidase domain
LLLCAVALVATALNLAPIEIQRRLIDDAIANSDLDLLLRLGALYAAIVVAHQIVKFALRVGQGWLSESATLYTRRHLLGLHAAGAVGVEAPTGETVSIIGGEVERLGGFVGEGPSTAVADASVLVGAAAYMLYVDPTVGALGLALVAPQILVTPLMQRRLNRLMARQVDINRSFGAEIADVQAAGAGRGEALARRLYRNRIAMTLWKQAAKAILNLLNAAAPLALLLVGGWLALRGETTVGVLVAFLSGFQRMSEPIRNLIAFYRQAAQAEVRHAAIAAWMTPGARR